MGCEMKESIQMVYVTWPPYTYMVKTLKIYFSEIKKPISIGCSRSTKFVEMMTLG